MTLQAYAFGAGIHCLKCAYAWFRQGPDKEARPVYTWDETLADLSIEEGGRDVRCVECNILIIPNKKVFDDGL